MINGYELDLKGTEEEKKRLREIIEDLPFDISLKKKGLLSWFLEREPLLSIGYKKENNLEHVTFFPCEGSVSISFGNFTLIKDRSYKFTYEENRIKYDVWYTG